MSQLTLQQTYALERFEGNRRARVIGWHAEAAGPVVEIIHTDDDGNYTQYSQFVVLPNGAEEDFDDGGPFNRAAARLEARNDR